MNNIFFTSDTHFGHQRTLERSYMGDDKWHTFNQVDAEKFTLGDFQGHNE